MARNGIGPAFDKELVRPIFERYKQIVGEVGSTFGS